MTRAKRKREKRKRRWPPSRVITGEDGTDTPAASHEQVMAVRGAQEEKSESPVTGEGPALRKSDLRPGLRPESQNNRKQDTAQLVADGTADGVPNGGGQKSASVGDTKKPAAGDSAATESIVEVAGAGEEPGVERASEEVSLPPNIVNCTGVMSGGNTTASRRRQRRAEGAVAATHQILVLEVRERREERAKVLRLVVQQVIEDMRELDGRKQPKRAKRVVRVAATTARQATRVTEQQAGQRVSSSGATPTPEEPHTAKQQPAEQT